MNQLSCRPKVDCAYSSFGPYGDDAIKVIEPVATFEKNPDNRPLTRDELLEAARDADGIIIWCEWLDESLFERLDNLKIIGWHPAGLDGLDPTAATKAGITVVYTPGAKADYKMKGIYAYDKPTKTIPIYFSAFGPKSAALAGKYGDHLMTYGSPEYVKKSVLSYFEEAARNAGKDPARMDKSVYLDGGYGNLKRLVSKYRVTSAGSLLPDERDPRKIQASAVKVSDD